MLLSCCPLDAPGDSLLGSSRTAKACPPRSFAERSTIEAGVVTQSAVGRKSSSSSMDSSSSSSAVVRVAACSKMGFTVAPAVRRGVEGGGRGVGGGRSAWNGGGRSAARVDRVCVRPAYVYRGTSTEEERAMLAPIVSGPCSSAASRR